MSLSVAHLSAVDSAPRDRECYFRAAYDLLAAHGSAGLTVAALCERVGVTKGSFYHHFADLPEFVAAFAQRWRRWVEHIVDDYAAEPDPLRQYELITNSHIVLMTGAEPAIWAWARTEPVVAAAVQELLARFDGLAMPFYIALTGDVCLAAVLKQLVFCAMVGLQQRTAPVDPDRFVRVLAELARRGLHLDTEVVVAGGRTLVRVHRRLPEPIPPYRPISLPERAPDGSRPLFDSAIAVAVAALSPDTGRGREAYFRAARDILAKQGSDGVTVAAMCERLGVTKGSFHHHFATITAFVAALAQHWEQKFGALIDNYDTEPDPLRRLELMFRTSFALPHPTEAAFRAWGRTNPIVAAVLRRQENRAEQVLRDLLTELLGDAEAADLMAELGLGLAIGLQVWDPPLDPEVFVVTFIEWARRCLGLEADLVTVDGALRVHLARAQ